MPRALIQINFSGAPLVGTVHEPPHPAASPAGRVALVLFNAGPAPRAGNSDLYARLGDQLATRGMLCMRFDLPGLGDSQGGSWPDIATYWRAVQQGTHDLAISHIIDQARERYAVARVVLGGLCAGAICALRASDRAAALVLLEPNFREAAEPHRASSTSPTKPAHSLPRNSLRRRISRALDVNYLLYRAIGPGRHAPFMRPLVPIARSLLVRRAGHLLPPGTLPGLVDLWQRSIERGVPCLVVCARSSSNEHPLEPVIRAMPGKAQQRLARADVQGTNHIFTAGSGRDGCIAVVSDWLGRQFPGALNQPHTITERRAGATPVAIDPI